MYLTIWSRKQPQLVSPFIIIFLKRIMRFGKKMSYGIAYTDYDTDKVFAIDLVSTITCCIIQPGLRNRLTVIYRNTTLQNPEFAYPVTVHWGRGSDTMAYWDRLCIASIEMFGCPGDKFVTDISADRMIWSFRDPKDAFIFKLKFSEVAC